MVAIATLYATIAAVTFFEVGVLEKWPLTIQLAATIFWPVYVCYQIYRLIK